MMSTSRVFLIGGLLAVAFSFVLAQSPAPIVVPAASQLTPAQNVAAAPPASDSASLLATIKLLEEMKAKNADTLQKQEATLQKLEELQEAADQLKTFAKRG